MRLRNIPGAREEVSESRFAVNLPAEQRGQWRSLFRQQYPDGRDTGEMPLYIEVGMGKGRFLTEMAAQHPEALFAGIEMYESVLIKAVQKLERLEEQGVLCPNLLLIREDARLLPDLFAEGEVDKIFLNFSDPWPKARHAKRRLTSHQFLERYGKILKPGGTVEFKTDNQELFTFSLEEAREAGWEILVNTRDLHHEPALMEGNVMTEYEQKFSAKGNPICKMVIKMTNSHLVDNGTYLW
ncbi:MAG: tRNA (guanosine(46)-N7)-methyltransferase TrmB [Blautia sp.]|nr:tRNA (guanosine(46)-N7)-methyltransferase TrmB [Blautia sp.]